MCRHQAPTIQRFDAILDAGVGGVHPMSVLQGWTPDDDRRRLDAHGDRIAPKAWAGGGSLCKRQGDPAFIAGMLDGVD